MTAVLEQKGYFLKIIVIFFFPPKIAPDSLLQLPGIL